MTFAGNKLASLLLAGAAALVGSITAAAQARPAITGIAFMRVYTTDPNAADRFYGRTLGYSRVEATLPGAFNHDAELWVYPVNDRQWIEVLPHTPPPTPNLRTAAIGFRTRDAAGLERYLHAHGVAIDQPLDSAEPGEFAVRDPEGNHVVFVQEGAKAGPAHLAALAAASPAAASRRLIHVGFIVRDRRAEDDFWRGLLGFRPYWHGGWKADKDDWVSLQVPDGTDWLEYMLNITPAPTLRDSGTQNHFSLGVNGMNSVLAQLQRNGCEGKDCTAIQAGRDGKIQLNLFDPDQTRVEFMEFTPAMKPCCSEFAGAHPAKDRD